MSTLTFTNSDADLSSGLGSADEYPLQESTGEPLFSEGLYFEGYDPDTNIGFWLACHPTPYDFGLVREIVGIFLPDGRILLAKGFGRNRTERTQAGANLYFECVEPFKHWQLRYQANAIVRDKAATLTSRLTDDLYVPLSFTIDVYGRTPVWISGSGSAESQRAQAHSAGGRSHYNQLFEFEGSVGFENRSHEISGTGVRDHSRGPRDFGGASGHEFIFGYFPYSGRAFGVFSARGAGGGPALQQGYVVENGVVHHSTSVEVSQLVALRERDEQVTVRIATDLGVHEIRGTTLDAAGWMMFAPNEVLFGIDPTLEDGLPFTESHTRWTWDGETTVGLCERSNRWDNFVDGTEDGRPARSVPRPS